jgi:hypothetical protein
MRITYLLAFLIVGSAFAKPCGLQGTIEDRIKDCAVVKGDFALVTMTEKGAEFYKDLKTKLIWGVRIATDFNHYGSQKACTDELPDYQAVGSFKWRLPTINEFEQAAAHGMKAALPNSDYSFWSSTGVKRKRSRRNRGMPAAVYLWDGTDQRTDTGDLKDGASVRCVTKDQT